MGCGFAKLCEHDFQDMAAGANPTEGVRDADGSAQVAWVAPLVLLARFEGALSANLGKTFANHLQQLISGQHGVHYFGDARQLKHYDLVARSAFVRILLEHKKAFASLQILMPGPDLSASERAVAAAVGEPLHLLVDPSAFEAALARVAPKYHDPSKRRG